MWQSKKHKYSVPHSTCGWWAWSVSLSHCLGLGGSDVVMKKCNNSFIPSRGHLFLYCICPVTRNGPFLIRSGSVNRISFKGEMWILDINSNYLSHFRNVSSTMCKVFPVIFLEGGVLALTLVISVYMHCYDLMGLSNFLIHLQLLKNRRIVYYIITFISKNYV